jgi:hypothetical protein
VARRPSPVFRRARSRTALRGRTGVVVGVLILVAIGLFGAFRDGSLLPGGAQSGGVSTPVVIAEGSTARDVLDTLVVKGKSPRTGYDREGKFGSAWIDVDGNGCDTRNDILARDLTQIVFGDDCRVLSGVIDDPYTGAQIPFVRGEDTSALVQIDHVVALSNAWQTGAQQISEEARVAFANDPLNLLAVDGASNSQKGDGDTATWLPANTGFRCEYVARQVSVKATYGLWVTTAERDAMLRVLTGCPGQLAITR